MSESLHTSAPWHPATRWTLKVAPAVCAAALTLFPGPAQAQTLADSDSVGDVVEYGGKAPVPAPDRALSDITNTRIVHSDRRVRVTVSHVDLRKAEFHSLYVGMVTNEGVRRHLSIDAFPGRANAEVDLSDNRARHVRCAIRHSIDYQANVVDVSFPRSCASGPRWIRFRVGAMSLAVNSAGERIFVDDALRDRPINDQDRNLALSARVYRGDAG